MKIAPEIYASMLADIREVARALKVDVSAADGGSTGLKAMHNLLTVVSRCCAFNDSHPAFSTGTWTRLLPYDGRDYCFYYANGCDDTHLATALRRIKAQLTEEAVA